MSLVSKLHKVKIYYKDQLISDEPIIRDYMDFLVRHLSTTPTLSLHTGSKCFDIVSIIVTFLKVAEEAITQDFNIENLVPGDIVLHRTADGQTRRERWIGIEKEPNGIEYIVTEEDGDGINGKLSYYNPRETEESEYLPYIGESRTTGITKLSTQNGALNNLLGYIFNRDPRTIPVLAHTIETVVDRNYFEDLIQNTKLVYANTNQAKLSDLVPFCYETKNSILHQIGPNSEKLTPVFIYTEKLSAARSRMFNNKDLPFTLLVLKDITNADVVTDLDDFIDSGNDRINHVLISTKIHSQISRYLLDQDIDLNIYALSEEKTKNYLASPIMNSNPITIELNQQLKQSVLKYKVEEILVSGGLSQEDYYEIRKYAFSESFPDEIKDDIKINILTLLKSLNTMCFSIESLKNSLPSLERASSIKTPDQCLDELSKIALEYPLNESVKAKLTNAVSAVRDTNPKYAKLQELLHSYKSLSTILIIVEKAYYKEILSSLISDYPNVKIVTASEMLRQTTNPDLIIVTSLMLSAKTDIFYFAFSTKTIALLYENEKYLYEKQRTYSNSYLKKLHLRLNHTSVNSQEYQDVVKNEAIAKRDVEDNFISLLDEINKLRRTDSIRYFQGGNSVGPSGGYECSYIALLSESNQIAFSKNYSAAVYDPESGEITEKTPDELEPGDKIIFIKNSSVKSGIIDYILHKLCQEKIFSPEFIKQYELSQVWKKALEDFRTSKNFSISELYYYFSQKADKSFSYQTFLTWIKNPTIVGPQHAETLKIIGETIGHPDLANNYQQHYEAIKAVRSERLKIINLIGKIIKRDLVVQQKPEPSDHEVFEAIRNNINELSVILEVEQITKLDPPRLLSSNYINKPICIES